MPIPKPQCGYDINMDELKRAHERPLILESTRSHKGEDAWRDMDGFDGEEELARLRRAVHEVRKLNPSKGFARHHAWTVDRLEDPTHKLLAFIAMAFDNIDERLVRLGPLPTPWMGSSSLNRPGHGQR